MGTDSKGKREGCTLFLLQKSIIKLTQTKIHT